MSVYFSRFGLNTWQGTPYFSAFLPEGYPTSLTLRGRGPSAGSRLTSGS